MWIARAAIRTMLAGPGAGDDEPPALHLVHGLQADQPDGVVGEVREREREQDQTRSDPQLLGVTSKQDGRQGGHLRLRRGELFTGWQRTSTGYDAMVSRVTPVAGFGHGRCNPVTSR